MTTATSKIRLTAGALAVAAATALTPVVAQAAPADNTDSSATDNTSSNATDNTNSSGAGNTNSNATDNTNPSGVGDSAGATTPAKRAPRDTVRGGQQRAPVAVGGTPASGATGSNPLFQNPLWWFGTPNPASPTPAYTRTFDPLASLPGWTTAYNGWYSNMNFEACVLGLSTTTTRSVGPYGTATNSVSTGGC
jgi:hypothetical protein